MRSRRDAWRGARSLLPNRLLTQDVRSIRSGATGEARTSPHSPSVPTPMLSASLVASSASAPLLDDGALRERVIHSIAEIAAALREPLGADAPVSVLMGRSLFFLHHGLATGADKDIATAVTFVEAAAAALATKPLSAALYGGVAGVAWLLSHGERLGVSGWGFDLTELDALLLDHLRAEDGRPQHFDLVSGVVGLGVYFLERAAQAAGDDGVHLAVQRLEASAARETTGATWLAAPRFVGPTARSEYPQGRYDLGLAHGTAGVTAFLALAVAAGVAPAGTPTLLAESVRWLQSTRHGSEAPSDFGAVLPIGAARPAPGCRAAWCYGDPGVAAALWHAGRALNDAALVEDALAVATRAACRSVEHAGVVDASLCHGAAGLAHIYAVIGGNDRRSPLAAAARRWVAVTYAQRMPGSGVAGYHYVRGAEPASMRGDVSFLTGVAGIGLTLTFAAHGGDRSWDRLLLLS